MSRARCRFTAVLRSAHPSVPVLLGGQAVANPEVAAVVGASFWSAGADLVSTLDRLMAARQPQRRSATHP